MADKGKKDKDKARKQKIKKQEQSAKRELEKQPIKAPLSSLAAMSLGGKRGSFMVPI
ncbi:MAG TPA: hypothetical protein VE616_06920 [Candidatus Udaeobacter sp.]|nr:hypothetical protein [Candidatus Udaeobacter sp.]